MTQNQPRPNLVTEIDLTKDKLYKVRPLFTRSKIPKDSFSTKKVSLPNITMITLLTEFKITNC